MVDAPVTPLARWEVAAPQSPRVTLRQQLDQRAEALRAALLTLDIAPLEEAGALLIGALREGHKILVAGNGGSAAEAQHFAGELVGRFRRERAAYAAVALTAD